MRKRVAVVLSGCGVYDGAEITESVAALVHLSRLGLQSVCFAPDVVDHASGKEAQGETRNVMVESARGAGGAGGLWGRQEPEQLCL